MANLPEYLLPDGVELEQAERPPYGAAEFLSVQDYRKVQRWVTRSFSGQP
jgi:hypothetical protein